ncbi:hypothetical protein [Tessaracoccus sp.]|nr:hypothetical protein [Tessaracoccus sp.]
MRVDRWILEGGEYVVEVGASSRDLRARTTVTSGAMPWCCRSR